MPWPCRLCASACGNRRQLGPTWQPRSALISTAEPAPCQERPNRIEAPSETPYDSIGSSCDPPASRAIPGRPSLTKQLFVTVPAATIPNTSSYLTRTWAARGQIEIWPSFARRRYPPKVGNGTRIGGTARLASGSQTQKNCPNPPTTTVPAPAENRSRLRCAAPHWPSCPGPGHSTKDEAGEPEAPDPGRRKSTLAVAEV